jgi:hypothetical protein
MQSTASTPDAYLDSLPEDRKEAVSRLRDLFRQHLPPGFEETMANGMIGFVVPYSLYPAGYHCEPKQPLPFLTLASQKSHIAVYHMGLYAMPDLLAWFTEQWAVESKRKLDMGKSCIRLKKPEDIPYRLFEELAGKVSPQQWIATYEQAFRRKS